MYEMKCFFDLMLLIFSAHLLLKNIYYFYWLHPQQRLFYNDFLYKQKNYSTYANHRAYGKQYPEHRRPTKLIRNQSKPVRANCTAQIAESVEYPCNEPRVYFSLHKQGENRRYHAVGRRNQEAHKRKADERQDELI